MWPLSELNFLFHFTTCIFTLPLVVLHVISYYQLATFTIELGKLEKALKQFAVETC